MSLLLGLREASPRRLRGTGTRWAAWQRLQDGQRVVDAELHLVRPARTMAPISPSQAGSSAAMDMGTDSGAAGGSITAAAHGRDGVKGSEQRSHTEVRRGCTCPGRGSSTFRQGSTGTGTNSDEQIKANHTHPRQRMRHAGLDASTGLNMWYAGSPGGLPSPAGHPHRDYACRLGCSLS